MRRGKESESKVSPSQAVDKQEAMDELTRVVKDMFCKMSQEFEQAARRAKCIEMSINKLQDQVVGMTQELKIVKQKAKEVGERAESNETKISRLDERMSKTNKKLIYLEDNSRRSNIKIRNF